MKDMYSVVREQQKYLIQEDLIFWSNAALSI